MKDDPTRDTWLLLLHHLPAKPDYLRVKIWRRMQRIGAVALKNAAWVLPSGETAREDFEWLIREIEGEGGEAILCDARFLSGLSREQVNALRGLTAAAHGESAAPIRNASETIEQGHVWVTRRNVFVDRIASAWLINRYIDQEARFKFVDDSYEPQQDEIAFDMFGGEFTHIADACTFEVLASTFVPNDPAVARIAQIVHDIDMKDEKYVCAEVPGVERALRGLCMSMRDDSERLVRGGYLFDWLAAEFAST